MLDRRSLDFLQERPSVAFVEKNREEGTGIYDEPGKAAKANSRILRNVFPILKKVRLLPQSVVTAQKKTKQLFQLALQ